MKRQTMPTSRRIFLRRPRSKADWPHFHDGHRYPLTRQRSRISKNNVCRLTSFLNFLTNRPFPSLSGAQPRGLCSLLQLLNPAEPLHPRCPGYSSSATCLPPETTLVSGRKQIFDHLRPPLPLPCPAISSQPGLSSAKHQTHRETRMDSDAKIHNPKRIKRVLHSKGLGRRAW